MRLYLLPLPVFVLSVLGQGLQINVTSPVECDRKSHKGDVISVNYRGTFTNGTEFDSSYGGEPFSFTLGIGEVIEGFDQGLLDMCIGEKRTLTIPPELGYGDREVGPIPANSTLSRTLLTHLVNK